jgi:hypothetical protein
MAVEFKICNKKGVLEYFPWLKPGQAMAVHDYAGGILDIYVVECPDHDIGAFIYTPDIEVEHGKYVDTDLLIEEDVFRYVPPGQFTEIDMVYKRKRPSILHVRHLGANAYLLCSDEAKGYPAGRSWKIGRT